MPDLRRLRLLLAAYLFVSSAYFMPGASWNPVSRFALTRAIVELHSFEITRFANSTGDRAQVGERFYSDKAPIPSLLAVPAYAAFYAVAKARNKLPAFEALGPPERPAERVRVSPAFRMGLYVCSLSTSGLAGALLGVALFELLRRRVSLRAAMAGALATVLGTPLFVYSTSFFGHTIAAAFLLGAFALMVTASPEVKPKRLALSGACLALAVGSEYLSLIPAAVLALFFVGRAAAEGEGSGAWSTRARAAGWLALGALPPLAIIGAYHQTCFGAPWRTGYGFVTLPVFAQGHAQGLLGISTPKPAALFGLLFGRARGLFYLAPITAVGVAALALAWYRKRDGELAVAGLAFIALLLVNASYYMWDGGWATGPRHLVPAVAFLGLGIGFAFEQPKWRAVALLTASVSAWIMVMTTAVALEAPTQGDALFDYLIPALRAGRIARIPGASNLGLSFGISRALSALPALIGMAVGAWWLTERQLQADDSVEASTHSNL